MVAAGLTEALPSAGRLAPPSIDTFPALLVVQVKVADSPTVIVAVAVEKLSTLGGAGGAGLTVTVTLEVAVPPVPSA